MEKVPQRNQGKDKEVMKEINKPLKEIQSINNKTDEGNSSRL